MSNISKLAQEKKDNEIVSNGQGFRNEDVGEVAANSIDKVIDRHNKKNSNKYDDAVEQLKSQKEMVSNHLNQLCKLEKELEETTSRILKKMRKTSSESLQQVEKISKTWSGDYSDVFNNISELSKLMTVISGFVENKEAMELLNKLSK